MDTRQALREVGLEAREVDAYLALHELGPSSIRDVAKRADLNRGTAYEVLKTLQQKGVVCYFPKGKRRLFAAEPPETFLRLAEEKSAAIERTIGELKRKIIPDLEALRPEFKIANVRYYEGDDGIEFVLKDLLVTVEQSKEREYYVYSSKPIRKYLYRPFPGYTKQRVRRGLKVKVIAIGEGGEDAELAERKWIAASSPLVPSCYMAIYPPKYAVISLAHEDYPTAVVIDSPELASAQKLLFEALWGRL